MQTAALHYPTTLENASVHLEQSLCGLVHRRTTELETSAGLVDLILRVGNRDHLAFRLLHDRTSNRLFCLAMRVMRRRESAEDALQECFTTVWRTAASYRSEVSTPEAWMGLIVKSRALDLLRRKEERRSRLSEEFNELLHAGAESDSSDPLHCTATREQTAKLREKLSQLPSKQRNLLQLAYLKEMTHVENANASGLPLGTVKTSIRLGLATLRRQMRSSAQVVA